MAPSLCAPASPSSPSMASAAPSHAIPQEAGSPKSSGQAAFPWLPPWPRLLSVLHSLQELAMLSPPGLPGALSHSAVPGRRGSRGHRQSLVGHRLLCLGNREAAAAATVPAPHQELLPSSGGGEGQHPPAPGLCARALAWALCRAPALPQLLLLHSDHVCGMGTRQAAATSPLVHPDSGWGLLTKGCAGLCFDSG